MVLAWLKRNGIALVALALGALGVGAAMAAQEESEQLRADVSDKFDRYPGPEEMRRSKEVAQQFRDAFEQAMDAQTYAEGVDVPVDADILVLTGNLRNPLIRLKPNLELGPITHETSLGSMLHVTGDNQMIQGGDFRTEPTERVHEPLYDESILDVDIEDVLEEGDVDAEDIAEDEEQ